MDKMDTEKFIQCVKNSPVLYNTQHKQYKNFAQKTEVWERIAAEMNESSEVLRTKWKGLKDGYTKYKKWILYGHASGKSFSNWCWGPHLEFLDPYIHQRKRKDGDSTAGTQDSAFLHLELSRENEKDLETDQTLQNECIIKYEPVSVTSATSTPCTSRSQSRTSLRDPMTSVENDDNTKLLSFMHNKRSKGIDAVDLLFMSYADTFKKFSVGTQTKLKVKLATIFADAELLEHNQNVLL